MLSDSLNEMFSAAALTTTTTSSVINMGAKVNLGGGQNPMSFYADFLGVAPGGGSPTASLQFTGADSADLTSNPIHIGPAIAPTLVSGTVLGQNLYGFPIPPHQPKQYFGVIATLGGTSPTVSVTCGLVRDLQTNPVPPNL